MTAFRVLSMDGGGSWALIQVKALIELYGASMRGRTLLSHFDLAAANSGGSIVLGCLIEDFTLQQALSFFEDENRRKSVFAKTESTAYQLLHDLLGIGPKYSSQAKLGALQQVFAQRGDQPLSDAVAGIISPGGQSLHVLIVGFDYDRNRASFFRSRPVTGPSWGHGAEADVTLAEAIHASTNAPVNYFDGPAEVPSRDGRYWDGAITGCNNPVLAAVTEAIGIGQDPRNIIALSLGTATTALPWKQTGQPASAFVQPICEAGLKTDVRKLATSVLDDPPDAATFLAHVMTGCGAGLDSSMGLSRIVRLNPLVSPMRAPAGASDPWTPPGSLSPSQFQYILDLDMDAVEPDQVAAVSQYADLWVHDQALNQPIRMNGDSLTCELGHDTFTDAAAAWRKLSGLDEITTQADARPDEVTAQ